MQSIFNFLDQFVQHVLQEHPEHVLFYLIGSSVMTVILVINYKEFADGFKGRDGRWQISEIVIYLWTWMFTQSVLGVLFLDLKPPDYFWIFMGCCLLFGLAGKDGIHLLFNWRGVQPQAKEESKQKKDEQKVD